MPWRYFSNGNVTRRSSVPSSARSTESVPGYRARRRRRSASTQGEGTRGYDPRTRNDPPSGGAIVTVVSAWAGGDSTPGDSRPVDSDGAGPDGPVLPVVDPETEPSGVVDGDVEGHAKTTS